MRLITITPNISENVWGLLVVSGSVCILWLNALTLLNGLFIEIYITSLPLLPGSPRTQPGFLNSPRITDIKLNV